MGQSPSHTLILCIAIDRIMKFLYKIHKNEDSMTTEDCQVAEVSISSALFGVLDLTEGFKVAVPTIPYFSLTLPYLLSKAFPNQAEINTVQESAIATRNDNSRMLTMTRKDQNLASPTTNSIEKDIATSTNPIEKDIAKNQTFANGISTRTELFAGKKSTSTDPVDTLLSYLNFTK